MSANNTYCLSCRGEGIVHTGIGESPSTLCNACDGTGYVNYTPDALATSAPVAAQEEKRDVCAEMRALCESCGGTGDVTRSDGEYIGRCTCEHAQAPSIRVPLAMLCNWLALVHDNERSIGDRLQCLSARFSSLLKGDAPDKYPPFKIREQSTGMPVMPDLNDDLRDILGRPNFTCIRIAARLRELGHDIPTKAEHEQAATIYLLLTMYLKHGDKWRDEAEAYLKRAASLPVVEGSAI